MVLRIHSDIKNRNIPAIDMESSLMRLQVDSRRSSLPLGLVLVGGVVVDQALPIGLVYRGLFPAIRKTDRTALCLLLRDSDIDRIRRRAVLACAMNQAVRHFDGISGSQYLRCAPHRLRELQVQEA